MSNASKTRSESGSANQRGWPLTSARTGERERVVSQRPTAHLPSDGSQPAGANRNYRWTGRALAWSALMAITIVFALVLQALAASATVAPGPAALPPACRAALAAGDNQRESFLAHLCGSANGATSTSASTP
jgi:hypothetical protein